MTGPDDYTLSEPLHHVLRNLQNAPHWNTASDALVVPMSRDPAVLAALPEVQALIAAAIEVAARRYRFGGGVHGGYPMWHYSDAAEKAIRAVASADATAALAQIERGAEARGRVKGLREAAEIVTEVQRQEMSDTEGVMPPDRFDEGTSAAYETILARADQIEKDAK